VVGYFGKDLANPPFKATAGHFNRDPVVISKGIKGLEKRIREDEAITTAITMLRESLTKKQKPNTHLVKPDPGTFIRIPNIYACNSFTTN
jgi:hypothetical protein